MKVYKIREDDLEAVLVELSMWGLTSPRFVEALRVARLKREYREARTMEKLLCEKLAQLSDAPKTGPQHYRLVLAIHTQLGELSVRQNAISVALCKT